MTYQIIVWRWWHTRKNNLPKGRHMKRERPGVKSRAIASPQPQLPCRAKIRTVVAEPVEASWSCSSGSWRRLSEWRSSARYRRSRTDTGRRRARRRRTAGTSGTRRRWSPGAKLRRRADTAPAGRSARSCTSCWRRSERSAWTEGTCCQPRSYHRDLTGCSHSLLLVRRWPSHSDHGTSTPINTRCFIITGTGPPSRYCRMWWYRVA